MIGRRQPPSAHADGTGDPAVRGFDDFDLRLGDVMRGERATIGKSLLDVQRELKIKASYIAAIENCDVGAFETPGFVAGYVRSYARYLGMDPEWAYRRFCEEAGFAPLDGIAAAAIRRQPPAERSARRAAARDPYALGYGRFAPPSEPWLSRINPGALGSLTVLAVLIGAIGYGGWTVLQEVQRVQVAPVDAAPGVLADLDPLAGAGTPSEPGPAMPGLAAPAPDMPDRLYRPPALDVPVMVARDGPIATINPAATGALADAGAARNAAGPDGDEADAVTAEADAAERAEAGVQVVEAGPPQVEILAVRPSWVRVTAADGTILLERILDAGERYLVPQMEVAPRLRAGNSGSVYFVVGGQTYGPSAPGANIARNVDLGVAAVRETFARADLTADPDLARMVDVAEAAAD